MFGVFECLTPLGATVELSFAPPVLRQLRSGATDSLGKGAISETDRIRIEAAAQEGHDVDATQTSYLRRDYHGPLNVRPRESKWLLSI